MSDTCSAARLRSFPCPCHACVVDVDVTASSFFYSEGSGNLWCIFFYFPVTVFPPPFP